MTVYRRGMLSDLFQGVVVKKLTLVETVTPASSQHEIQGTKPLRQMFGDADRRQIPTRFVWLGEDQDGFSEEEISAGPMSARASRDLRSIISTIQGTLSPRP